MSDIGYESVIEGFFRVISISSRSNYLHDVDK